MWIFDLTRDNRNGQSEIPSRLFLISNDKLVQKSIYRFKEITTVSLLFSSHDILMWEQISNMYFAFLKRIKRLTSDIISVNKWRCRNIWKNMVWNTGKVYFIQSVNKFCPSTHSKRNFYCYFLSWNMSAPFDNWTSLKTKNNQILNNISLVAIFS